MALKKTALQTLSSIATVGLALSIAAPATAQEGGAKDLLTDNVHNMAGGGANIHADNTCVEKIGDTAHVKFMAQHQPLLTSSHRGQTSASGTLAIPANMENVKIRIKAVGHVKRTDVSAEDMSVEAETFDTPLEVPVEDGQGTGEGSNPVNFAPLYEEDKFVGGKESIEKNIADGAKLVRHHQADLKTESGELNNTIFPFSSYGNSEAPEYGHHDDEYDFYEFGNLYLPLTFEIEGDITTVGEDTFATAAVSNLGWLASSDTNSGSGDQEAESLMEHTEFRPGGLPPAVPEDENMIQTYKDKLSDAGLDISPAIAPTSEVSGDEKYSRIGGDARSSSRGDVGEAITRIYDLHELRAISFMGQAPESDEDGADVTAAHVTLCAAEDTPDTDVPETETPETETPETETPETDTPETETPETDTPETETPETEAPETETPDASNTDTPETGVPETDTPETETPESETNTPAPAPSDGGNTGSRTLASTGASVIGIGVVALVLLGAGIFLSRRKKD